MPSSKYIVFEKIIISKGLVRWNALCCICDSLYATGLIESSFDNFDYVQHNGFFVHETPKYEIHLSSNALSNSVSK